MTEPVYFIEPTNRCNLACPICPCNNEMNREKGYMNFSQFVHIIDSIQKHDNRDNKYLNLWGWGEPFLAPEIFSMIDYASSKKFKIRISTNLNLKELMIDKIVNSKLDLLIIGLDGITEDTYNSYRINGNINLVINNIHQLLDIKKRLSKSTPFILISTLLTKTNVHEIEKIKSFCEENKIDALVLKAPNLWRDLKTKDNIDSLFEKFIITEHPLTRYTENPQYERNRKMNNICPFVNKNGMVMWDSSTTICCFDHSGKHLISNNSTLSPYLKFITDGEKNMIRQNMINCNFRICNTCDSQSTRSSFFIYNKNLKQNRLLDYL